MTDYDDSEVDPLAKDDGPPNETSTEAARADVIPDDLEVPPDPTPGERLDTGEDIGKTLPVDVGGEILEAPAAAVLDPGPTPITPASSAQQYEDRVSFERGVNAQLDDWWELHRAAVLDTFLAGGTVDLTHDRPDVPAEKLEAVTEAQAKADAISGGAGDDVDTGNDEDLTPKS